MSAIQGDRVTPGVVPSALDRYILSDEAIPYSLKLIREILHGSMTIFHLSLK